MGCASYFKRQECEKVNWYEYGQNLALKGKFLEQDTFVKECKEVEAKIAYAKLDLGFKSGREKYCSPQQIYLTGKSGDILEYNFCDSLSKATMEANYQKGLNEFCTAKSGFEYGTSGKVYKNVCKGSAEEAFLPEYKKGRKKYLAAAIIESERKIYDLDRSISNVRRDKEVKLIELAAMPSATRYETVKEYDALTSSYKTVTKQVEDPYISNRRNNIQHDIDSLQGKISSMETEQSQLKKDMSQMRQELATLE